MPNSLADKLKSLGVKVGATGLAPAKTGRPGIAIETSLPGRWVETRRGEAFLVENNYTPDYRHGDFPIMLEAGLTGIAQWAGDPALRTMQPTDLAFLDTETSGLAGGTGTYAFMIGAARYINGSLHLVQFFMRDPAEEPALLEALSDFLAPCAALVTFNGKSFDAPLLKTRYTLHSIPCPFENFAHIDLLPLARRLWRDRLPSRALKALEVDIMKAARGADEVPGYEIPFLYFDFLRTGDATPLKGVFYHNQLDVVAMAALLQHTAGLLADPFEADLEYGLDVIALGKLFESLGDWNAAARLFERGLEMGLSPTDFSSATQRLSTLQRRRGDLDRAVALWKKAATAGHIYAHVELAKYHEHHAKDPAAALYWTLAAQKLVQDNPKMPLHEKKHWQAELKHRQERLETKREKKK